VGADVQGDSGKLSAMPLDLPALRQWISSLADDYAKSLARGSPRSGRKAAKAANSVAAELDAVSDDLAGSFGNARAEDVLRRLLAVGLVQYVTKVGRVPLDAAPERVILDVTAFALWSVVQARRLPEDWQGALARLTSPRMAELVAAARSVDAAQSTENFGVFAGLLAKRPISQGALNLLRDLGDQKRGGSALTALALAADLPRPDHKQREKSAVVWMFTALAAGALAAEGTNAAAAVNRVVDEMWDWITDSVAAGHGTPGTSGAHGGVLADELIHSFFH
jgi:hypothetical protein